MDQGQPDWNGLLAWSTKYHDGTKPSDVTPMTKEDRDWLAGAMKEYTFSDTDKLKDCVEAIKKDVDAGFKSDDMEQQLEELESIIEIHERNALNLARSGGLAILLNVCLNHPADECRALACQIFAMSVQNDKDVQKIALHSGALGLMAHFVKEKKLANKRAAITALSSFLRSDNFESKRTFITKMGGLEFLAGCLQDDAFKGKIFMKVVFLMYDLVLNDDSIFETDPQAVRRSFVDQVNIVPRLLQILESSAQILSLPEEEQTGNLNWDIREYILRILFRLYQVRPEQLKATQTALALHHGTLKTAMAATTAADQDKRELISMEAELVLKTLQAPSLPMEVNFQKEEEEEKKPVMALKM